MNKKRRDRLRQAYQHLSAADSIVGEVLEDEQNSLDNLPENLQSSSMAESMEEAIEAMEEVSDSIGEAIDRISELV